MEFHQLFLSSRESYKKKSNGNKLTATQHLPDIGCGTLPTTILTLNKTDNASAKIKFQHMCGPKPTLGGPINYRTLNYSSKNAELKHTLLHKSTTFSASRLFHSFLMSARSGSTRYHNSLPNKMSTDHTSESTRYIQLQSIRTCTLVNSSRGFWVT